MLPPVPMNTVDKKLEFIGLLCSRIRGELMAANTNGGVVKPTSTLEPAEESRAEDLARPRKTTYRELTDTQALRLSNQYWLLDRRRLHLEEDLKDLERKYKSIRKDLLEEMAVVTEELRRLDQGMFYRRIEEPVIEVDVESEAEQRASAPTNLVGD